MELAPPLSIEDYAKYPFLKQASTQIRELELTIQSLGDNMQVLERAQKRVETALQYVTVGEMVRDKKTEISSFAAAAILTIATKNSYVKKRYALAEAKSATARMLAEPKEKVLLLARDFNWDIDWGKPYKDYRLGFNFYLKNSAHLHGYEWKLVNQIMDSGMVYLNMDKAVRLLQEEIKSRIEKRLDIPEIKNLPPEITLLATKLNQMAKEIAGQETEELPKAVVQAAFPPCVNALYADAASNHHLSHVGRFTLTSFLINIGMTPEDVNELFKTFSDYNERLTRYQIEHIAGERGSATRYTPPQCSVLQTHGVCRNVDDLCRRIYHPLEYYRRKRGMVETQAKKSG
jgi:DNA primase large subunit